MNTTNIRLLLILIICSVAIINIRAQQRTYSTYYHQRVSLFEFLPVTSDDIIFLGNSITDGAEWCELLHNPRIRNRGISGDTTYGVYDRLNNILAGNPAKIFLLIGVNDLAQGIAPDSIVYRTGLIVSRIKAESPGTQLYIQSILPVNDCYNMFKGHTSRWELISVINRGLRELAEREGVIYIDLYTHFANEDGKLKPEYSNDGLHLMGKAYMEWAGIISPYISTPNKKTMETTWKPLPDLPGMNNTAPLGVSAPFTGLLNGNVVVAGGCNFPDKPVTEGGAKRYYNEIRMLTGDGDTAQWKLIGHLPYEVAYGATVYTDNGMVCIGGNNNKESFAGVYLLTCNKEDKRLEIKELPSLPQPMDNFAATVYGTRIYVAGGNQGGKPSSAFLYLDMENLQEGWHSLPNFPDGARVQPVLVSSASAGNLRIYLAGGFSSLPDRKPYVPGSVLRYCPENNLWDTVTHLPLLTDGSPRTLTGGCGVAYGDGILFFGGVNYNCFYQAIDRPRQIIQAKTEGNTLLVDSLEKEAREYMHHPVEWYRFNTELLYFNTSTLAWDVWAQSDKLARAGAEAVIHKDQLIVVNGELKPGIRTPEINALDISHSIFLFP